MSRAARVWDRAEATAALRTIREPIFRGALRAVLAMRWGIQSAGSLIVCRHGWHLTGPHEKLCVFCRTEIR